MATLNSFKTEKNYQRA